MSDDWKTKTYREGERFPGRIGRTFEDSEPALGREGLFAEREQMTIYEGAVRIQPFAAPQTLNRSWAPEK